MTEPLAYFPCNSDKSPAVRTPLETNMRAADCKPLVGLYAGQRGLLCLDFEFADVYERWRELVEGEGFDLTRCALVRTRGGGNHVWVRCADGAPEGEKLAFDPTRSRGELHNGLLIETRGANNQYAIVPPSPGWSYEPGSKTLEDLEACENWEFLLVAARSLDERPHLPITGEVPRTQGDKRPGDEYNDFGEPISAVLERNGWTVLNKKSNGYTMVRRPGKGDGWSASISADGTCFTCFTSSTSEFEAGRSYSKFAVLAHLEHGGDFSAAARSISDSLPTRKHVAPPGVKPVQRTSSYNIQAIGDMLKKPEEEFSWLVDGLLVDGGTSLIAAKPKVGKSTLLRALCFSVARGEPFLGRATRKGPVLYLAIEEKESQIIKQFRAMGTRQDDEIFVHVGSTPTEAVQLLISEMEKIAPALVVVDPLFKFVRVVDTSDYARVSGALEPVIDAARQTGAHFALAHHSGKGDREAGDSVLGSTAIFGAVDTLFQLKKSSDRRTGSVTQRYGEDWDEFVIELDKETYSVSSAGSLEGHQTRAALLKVVEVLRAEPYLEEKELKERIGGNTGLISKALRTEDGLRQISRMGSGKRGDPYKYSLSESSFLVFPKSVQNENEKLETVEREV